MQVYSALRCPSPPLPQLLLAQEYDDDWLANPVLAGSWGLDWAFKEQWDEAMQVRRLGERGGGEEGVLLCVMKHMHMLECG